MAIKVSDETSRAAQERLYRRGQKFAREVWEASGKQLTRVARDPERGQLAQEEWHHFRAGYRGELHVLNLRAEMGRKLP